MDLPAPLCPNMVMDVNYANMRALYRGVCMRVCTHAQENILSVVCTCATSVVLVRTFSFSYSQFRQ